MASTFRGASVYPGQADQQGFWQIKAPIRVSSFVAPKLEHRVLIGDRHLYPLTLTYSHLQCILSARVKTILTISKDDGRNGNDRVCIEKLSRDLIDYILHTSWKEIVSSQLLNDPS